MAFTGEKGIEATSDTFLNRELTGHLSEPTLRYLLFGISTTWTLHIYLHGIPGFISGIGPFEYRDFTQPGDVQAMVHRLRFTLPP